MPAARKLFPREVLVKTLRRLFLRAMMCGFLFGVGATCGHGVLTRPPLGWGDAAFTFLFALFVAAIAVTGPGLVEVHFEGRPPSLRRYAAAGLLAFVVALLSVAFASIQAVYAYEVVTRRSLGGALAAAKDHALAIVADPIALALVAGFAIPLAVVTVARVGRLHALVELVLIVVTSLVVTLPVTTWFLPAWDRKFFLVLYVVAGLAISIGGRLGELIARDLGRRFDEPG